MKALLFSLLFITSSTLIDAQQHRIDKLTHELSVTRNDTLVMIYSDMLGWLYTEIKADSSIIFFTRAIGLAQKFDYKLNETSALNGMGYALYVLGDYPKSLEVLLKATKIAENRHNIHNILPAKFFAIWNIPGGVTLQAHAQYPEKQRKNILANIDQILANVYGFGMGNIKKQLNYYDLSKELAETVGNTIILSYVYMNMGRVYEENLNLLDSALDLEKLASALVIQTGFRKYESYILGLIGDIYLKKKNRSLPLEYYRKALRSSIENDNKRSESRSYIKIAKYYAATGENDSSLYYAHKGLEMATARDFPELIVQASQLLTDFYKSNNKLDSAFIYQELMIQAKESIANTAKVIQFQNIDFDEQKRQQEIEAAQEQYLIKIKLYSLLAALVVFLLIAFILYRNNRNKQKAYALLQQQKLETDVQKERVETTLGELTIAKEQLEDKNRNLQIEGALERVRSRAMAMQKSDELKDLVSTVFNELSKLDLTLTRCFIYIIDEKSGSYRIWMLNVEDRTADSFQIQFFEHPYLTAFLNAWKERKTNWVYHLKGDEKTAVFDHLFSQTELKRLPDIVKAGMREPYGFFLSWAFFNFGGLQVDSIESLSEASLDILSRFGKVFDLTYTRFNDLKQAEAQAREARIEAALEKVRSRTMGMQHSDELLDVVTIVREKLEELEVAMDGGVTILTFIGGSRDADHWVYNPQRFSSSTCSHIPYFDHPLYRDLFVAKESGIDFFSRISSFDETNSFWKYAFENTDFKYWSDEVKNWILASESFAYSIAFASNSAITVNSFSGQVISEEQSEVLKRFANVFDQAYVRFLDLKKAEAQSRESQIQLGLERVRARAMAMQKSDELSDLVATVFNELTKLDFALTRCFIYIIDEKSQSYRAWMMNIEDRTPDSFHIPFFNLPYFIALLKAWKERKTKWVYHLTGEEKTSIGNFLLTETEFRRLPDIVKAGMMDPVEFYLSVSFCNFGGLQVDGTEPLSEANLDILSRFGKVFDLTYTRFNDLQKAEAQAREAEIQLALERVRAKTMAMQKQDDLLEVLNLLVEQLVKVGVRLDVANFSNGISDGDWNLWIDVVTDDGTIFSNYVHFPRIDHPYFNHLQENIEIFRNGGADLFKDVFSKQEKDSWQEYVYTQTIYKNIVPQNHKQYIYYKPGYTWSMIFLKDTWVSICRFNTVPFSDEEDALLRRFANAFGQAYTRFLDLQKAEAQAREAIKASSLDRIRAEIASMRTASDLQRITPSVWRELTALGVPFFRCGVFIINQKDQVVHMYLSTPEGKSLAALHLDFGSSEITTKAVEYWQQQKVYRTHWNRDQFIAWVQSLIGQGQLGEANTYQAGEEPPESLSLQFVPFAQGMLYVGSVEPLSESQIELVQSLAEAFSVAYARYEDFNNLEAAKQQVDKTLSELKAAQVQLIQSEKMASLGELTAGIAHEIQNPLNFVNNFSDVNAELINELKTELLANNKAEAILIADDIKENEQKINHHGKRADAIVKGMLQHSRASTGKKELTDINALADEYLRLAYHGLRAKDKNFNTEFKTDFDESIGKIEVVPQDIGRVLLNLYNNAFYAASQPSKGGLNKAHEPTVTVTTKTIPPSGAGGAGVLISVRDNGPGIPSHIVDKIFQPFFTTKPTGQGTGLGLSLSYDIIRAHGGELKVQTKEGEGAEFIVYLPTN